MPGSVRGSPDPTASAGDRSLAECLLRPDLAPETVFAMVTRFATESRNAGQRPEEMLARLQAIHTSAARATDRDDPPDASASLWSVMTSHAIAAYMEAAGRRVPPASRPPARPTARETPDTTIEQRRREAGS